jgi:AcrR family transcriptional regulator
LAPRRDQVAPAEAPEQEAAQKRKLRPRRSTQEVQALILKAARELFAERGYARATTKDIAAQAGASEVLVFRYFNSKAELFERAVSEPFDAFMHTFHQSHLEPVSSLEDVEARAGEYISGLFELLSSERQLMMALIANRTYEDVSAASSEAQAGLRQYFTAAEAHLAGVYKMRGAGPSFSPSLAGRLSFTVVVAAALFEDWLFPEEPPELLEKALSDFVLRGILGNS